MAKRIGFVVHATHPTTDQTHIIRREDGDGGIDAWAVHDGRTHLCPFYRTHGENEVYI